MSVWTKGITQILLFRAKASPRYDYYVRPRMNIIASIKIKEYFMTYIMSHCIYDLYNDIIHLNLSAMQIN